MHIRQTPDATVTDFCDRTYLTITVSPFMTMILLHPKYVGSLGFNPSVLRYCTSPENPSICDYLMIDSAHVDSPPSIPILCAVLLHPPAA
ncbi:hypothetical protein RRG08_038882 [Elysia crispata]|uniref:Uncharacterized protein n=1 Tax=Elysia crispata TaxID=231223 RepID=A0AAE0YSQ9_9GAST|nr:hypothetical protein RRG08_038882 [Elysia crispata]